jgi:hypothetical protein
MMVAMTDQSLADWMDYTMGAQMVEKTEMTRDSLWVRRKDMS